MSIDVPGAVPGRHRAGVRRAATTRRGAILVLAAFVVVLLALLGLHPASAAALRVGGSALGALSATAPCAPTSLAVVPSAASAGRASAVVVSDVPAACQGLPANVRLYRADGSAVATTDTTLTLPVASSATVAVPEFAVSDVAGVAMTVGTWGVATRWSAPVSAPSGPVTAGANTVLDALTWPVVQGGGTQLCFEARVTTTSATPVAWSIDMHVDQRPFNGEGRASAYSINRSDLSTFTTASAVGGTLTIIGNPNADQWNTVARIKAGQYVTVDVCDWSAPAPVYDPALTYTVTTAQPTGSVEYACVRSTVSVTGSPQFYAGWRADVDLGPLFAKITADGRAAGSPAVYYDGGTFSIARLSGDVWRVAATGSASYGVRDDVSRSFSVCLGH